MPDYQSAIRTMAAGESVLIVIEGRGGYHLAIGHPPATEVECGDERDNDFDGNADSFDSDCPLAP